MKRTMSEYTAPEIVDSFLDHIRYLNIAHHVPGRIRVKAGLNGARKLAGMDQNDINAIISRIPGIEEYRVNRKALSVIITYNPEVLPFQLWEDVGTLSEYPLHRDSVRAQLLDILSSDS